MESNCGVVEGGTVGGFDRIERVRDIGSLLSKEGFNKYFYKKWGAVVMDEMIERVQEVLELDEDELHELVKQGVVMATQKNFGSREAELLRQELQDF